MNASPNRKTSVINQLIFWFLFFLFTYRFTGIGSNDDYRTFVVTSIIVFIFASICYLNVLVLIPNLLTNKKYKIYGISVVLILVLIPTIFIRFELVQFLHEKPDLSRIVDHNTDRPKFTLILLVTLLFLFVSTIIRLALDFSKKEKQKIQIEKERLRIETQYLRSQMNPHFFLNALNNLQSIIRLSPKQTEKYINTLAEMMRYVTYDCKNNRVSINKEINYISNYIYFQQIKDNDITVTFQNDIEDSEAQIEPMLLMPFVENAFKYNSFSNGNLHPILINISQYKGNIHFSCKNNFTPNSQIKTDPSYSGLGIKNVKERLNTSYPNKHDLNIKINNIEFIVDLKLN
jgi:sensor histidine kinase YesM